MDWQRETLMTTRTIVAALLGAGIGWERERHGREAGIHTDAAVSVGACVFGLISAHVEGTPDPYSCPSDEWGWVSRRGVMLRERGQITGLTTAATLWATAAVGLATAYGMYVVGARTALLGGVTRVIQVQILRV